MPYADPQKRRECQKASRKRWEIKNREHRLVYLREWRRRWRTANPELNKAVKKKSYLKHRTRYVAKMRANHKAAMLDPIKRAKRNAAGKAWKEANPEKVRTSIRNWCDNNREHVRLWWKRHSALRRHRVGTFTFAQWYARVAFYGWRCAYCLKELTEATLTIDHIIPIIVGGTNWASNLAPACRSCNVRKNRNRKLPTWLCKKLS